MPTEAEWEIGARSGQHMLLGVTHLSVTPRIQITTFDSECGDGPLENTPARLTPWARQLGDSTEPSF